MLLVTLQKPFSTQRFDLLFLFFFFFLPVERNCGYAWSTVVVDRCRISITVSLLHVHNKQDTHLTLAFQKPPSTELNCVPTVTGPLSELQIAYVCRETLQVITEYLCFYCCGFQSQQELIMHQYNFP